MRGLLFLFKTIAGPDYQSVESIWRIWSSSGTALVVLLHQAETKCLCVNSAA